ncbi:MAG: hypothetical protein ACT443_07815 [Gemmatimonadota bacterium]
MRPRQIPVIRCAVPQPLANLAAVHALHFTLVRALAIGAAIVFAGLGARYVLMPAAKAWLDRQRLIADESALHERELAIIAGEKLSNASIRATAGQISSGYRRILKAPEPNLATAAVLAYLDSVSAASRIMITQADARGTTAAGGKLFAFTTDVTGVSDFEGILTWLRALETGPLLVHVPKLTIESADAQATAGSQTLTLKAEVRMYFASEASPAVVK